MIKLVESGLFGDRLVFIEKPMMVKRYNECLQDIGLEPTGLQKFHIDGWGWSPEIAEEKNDRYYLSHGLANPFGIILTPEQKYSPLYMAFHSFDWDIHRQVFENYELQIQDVTSEYGIWYELDQNITAYRSSRDLLMMEVINVQFHVAGDIQEAAKYQKNLVKTFSEQPLAWFDEGLREKIIHSSKLYGDLRYRNVELPDFPVSNVSTYYTVAFGGLYVFKNPGMKKPLLIYEDNSSEVSNDESGAHVEFNIEDESFLPYLFNQGMLSADPQFFEEHVFLLEQQLEYMLVKAAIKYDNTLEVDKLNNPQKKGLVNKLLERDLIQNEYFDLENFINLINQGQAGHAKMPASLNQALIHPAKETTRQEKIVLWQLLTHVYQYNPILTYAFNKPEFYNDYKTWEEPVQHWVISNIKKNKDTFRKLIR